LSFALTVDCKPYVKNLVARRANEKPPHGTISFLEHTMEAVLVIALGTDFKFLTSVHSMYLVIHLTNLQMLVVLVGMVRKFPARSEPVDQNLHIVTPSSTLFHLWSASPKKRRIPSVILIPFLFHRCLSEKDHARQRLAGSYPHWCPAQVHG
jgi:hypothetical protein